MTIRSSIRAALAVAAVAAACGFAPAVSAANTVTSGPERIPFKQDEDDFGATMWRAVLGTAVIALGAIGAVFYLRRRGFAPTTTPSAASPVRILQSLRAGPRTNLLVVQFGAQRLLLGQGEHGLRVLAAEPVEGAHE